MKEKQTGGRPESPAISVILYCVATLGVIVAAFEALSVEVAASGAVFIGAMLLFGIGTAVARLDAIEQHARIASDHIQQQTKMMADIANTNDIANINANQIEQ